MRKLLGLFLALWLVLPSTVAFADTVVVGGGGTGTFSVTDITGQTDDTTPATTATAVLAQGGSLIESTLGQIGTAINPTAATLHIDDILTALGIASEAAHFGAFTGSTITDNQTAKAAIQLLETAVETKQANLSLLPGTYTNTYLCTYTTAGTLFDCNTNPALFQAADADISSLASGLTGPIKGLGNGNGYSAAAVADIVALWTTCTGYLKNDGTCDTGGTGDVTGAGDCASGACYDGSSDGGTYIRLYDGTSAYVGITATPRVLTLLPSNANAEGLILTFGDNNQTITMTSGTGANVFDLSAFTVNVGALSAAASASPTWLFNDSDAPGTDKEIAKIVGAYIDGADGAENGTASIYVHEAGSTTEYIQADGKNAIIDMLKPVVLASTLKLYSANDPDVSAEGHITWDANGDYMRGHDGTRQVAIARVQEEIHVTVVKPQDMADAVRDAFLVWSNESGMTFTVTGWKCWAGADDTSLNIETTAADGSGNATVDAVECATGSGPYTGADTTITAASIVNGSLIWLDFDDTDDPSYVKLTIYGYYGADVN